VYTIGRAGRHYDADGEELDECGRMRLRALVDEEKVSGSCIGC
jgi:hypothetical protein